MCSITVCGSLTHAFLGAWDIHSYCLAPAIAFTSHLNYAFIALHNCVIISPTAYYFEYSKGLITLCVVSLGFLFHLAFFILPRVLPRVFPRVLDTNMLVSKTRVKTQEKCKKNARKIQNASPTRDNVSILHYKNVIQSRFARVLLTNFTKMQTQRIV